MKKLLFLLFLPIISYGQGHYPLAGANDTLDEPNSRTAGRDYYSTVPRALQPSDKVYKSHVDSLNAALFLDVTQVTLPQNGFSYIGFDDIDTPIIPKSASGDDMLIRELGNVFEVPGGLYTTYSGSTDPYNQNNVYVFGAKSTNGGLTWIKQGKLLGNDTAEDPNIIFFHGQYIAYAEDKTVAPSPGIHGWTSTDLITWVDQGIVLAKNAALNWQNIDVSSPTPYVVNDSVYLFYESRGSVTGGAVGLSKSATGLSFIQYTNSPVLSGSDMGTGATWSVGSWFSHLVPDNILRLNNRYFMTAHAWNGDYFAMANFSSYDLITWSDEITTWGTAPYKRENLGEGVMPYLYNGKLFATFGLGSSVFKGIFKQNPYSNSTTVTKALGTGIRCIKNAFHDETIIAKHTAAANFDLCYEEEVYESTSVGAGFHKIIKNDTAFTLTLRPMGGVTVDNSTSNITLAPGQYIHLVSTSTNAYTTVDKSLAPGYGVSISSGVISADTTGLVTQYDLSQDNLQAVTTRGAITTNAVTVSNNLTVSGDIKVNPSNYSIPDSVATWQGGIFRRTSIAALTSQIGLANYLRQGGDSRGVNDTSGTIDAFDYVLMANLKMRQKLLSAGGTNFYDAAGAAIVLTVNTGGDLLPGTNGTNGIGSTTLNYNNLNGRIVRSDQALQLRGVTNITMATNTTSPTTGLTMFQTTRNVQLQDGGTFTDLTAAQLQVNSTTRGFAMPRMTGTQVGAISSPFEGLEAFNTTTHAPNYYNGSAWVGPAFQTTLTGSGTGAATAINVTLPATSTWVMVGAANAAAAGITYWTVSGTTLTINYAVAPANGTNNLSYWIEYK